MLLHILCPAKKIPIGITRTLAFIANPSSDKAHASRPSVQRLLTGLQSLPSSKQEGRLFRAYPNRHRGHPTPPLLRGGPPRRITQTGVRKPARHPDKLGALVPTRTGALGWPKVCGCSCVSGRVAQLPSEVIRQEVFKIFSRWFSRVIFRFGCGRRVRRWDCHFSAKRLRKFLHCRVCAWTSISR